MFEGSVIVWVPDIKTQSIEKRILGSGVDRETVLLDRLGASSHIDTKSTRTETRDTCFLDRFY